MIKLIELIKEKNIEILLATNSTRRIEILKNTNIPFTVIKGTSCDETINNKLKGHEIVLHLARKKSTSFIHLIKENSILITADTIVYLNKKVIGKPENKDDAIRILSLLSNKKHLVYTGVNLRTYKREYSFYEKTLVYFNKLTKKDIIYYVDNYKPYDKAGSYGIQEWIGIIGVKRIEGCYYNVMGLPVNKLLIYLNKIIKEL